MAVSSSGYLGEQGRKPVQRYGSEDDHTPLISIACLDTFTNALRAGAIDFLQHIMFMTRGSIAEAARIAGKNRADFYKLIDRYHPLNEEPATPIPEAILSGGTFASHLHEIAVDYLEALLHMTNNNVSESCRIAGRNRTAMYELLYRYGVRVKRPPGNEYWHSLADG